ncbi:MAG: restriction endonuclease subunit S [Candidatus Riflebacteria bacterium]|nr:restriction endonuclease subunit S [Candidatus Riflebacteria bacterium]
MKNGDLLVCEGGEIGRCAIWKNQLTDCYFQKALHRIRVDPEKLNVEFLEYLFFFFALMHGFKSVSSKATIAHLTGEKLKEIKIPVPPLEIQKKFRSLVEKIENIKIRYQQNLGELESLFGSLSQRAFKGELDVSNVPLEENEMTQPESPVEAPEAVEKETVKADFSEAAILAALKKSTSKPLSFDDLFARLQKDETAEMVDYEKVKEIIFSLLKKKTLSQNFDEKKKEMILNLKK